MDEYISKQSVIDYLNGYLNSIGEDGTYSPLFDRGQRRALINSIQDISVIKGADVQPVKHGHWVEKEAYEEDRQMGFNFQIVCSNCDEQNSVLYFDENSEPTEKYFMRTPWCPWCGARMDGDSDGQ